MDSERPGTEAPVLAAAATAVLAAAIGLGLAWPAERPVVGSGLLLIASLLWFWSALRRLLRRASHTRRMDPPARHDEARLRQRELQAELATARLDLAPVALWHQAQDGRPAEALNMAARRLLAPGGANSPQALLAQLFSHAEAASQARQLLCYDSGRGEERCLLSACGMVEAGEPGWLLALMPVESALQAQTFEAWRQLVQVLTHEIMNSLTPIRSLAASALELRGDPEPSAQQDLTLALETVARRAEGLGGFVTRFRSLTDWPAPQPERVDLKALFARLEAMVGPGWCARGGEARFILDVGAAHLMADPHQLEQALLNLMRNAEQATRDTMRPQLQVRAEFGGGGRLMLSVRDNGPGVPPGLEQQIFLPFFSTREPSPSRTAGMPAAPAGIGLAVVRHLVHGMGGTVRHVRPPDGGAQFLISF